MPHPIPSLLASGLAFEFRLQLFNPGFSFAQRQQDLGRWSAAACTGRGHHRTPQSPPAGGSLEERCPSCRQGAASAWHQAGVSHQLPNPVSPTNTSVAAGIGLAAEACWRTKSCWAPLSCTPPCRRIGHGSAGAGSGGDASPVPTTRFAWDKAWPCQDQWPSLQPAGGGLKPSSDMQDLPSMSVDTMITMFVMLNTTI